MPKHNHNPKVGTMETILSQLLNGLDKGSAYALIALGLTLIFGTLGVVNFAHGAIFMIGAFCAVTLSRIFSISFETVDPTKTDFLGNPAVIKTPYVEAWFGPETGAWLIDWSVPLAILFSIPIMIAVGYIMERGLIKHFYKRPARRPDPRDLWSGHRASGSDQVFLRRQPHFDPRTGRL